MRDWKVPAELLPTLTLAADARLAPVDYYDDQVWGLTTTGGEPAAFAVQTTYGLRARSMRLFPRFLEGDEESTDPARFATPVIVHRFFPNYLLATFSPFAGIEVVAEYWAPASHALAGRLRVLNTGVTPRALRLEWVALLIPGEEGQRITTVKMDGANVLVGGLKDLAPVVFVAGAPEASNSPYPCLITGITLPPGAGQQSTWVHVALPNAEKALALARHLAAKNWDAEIARVEMSNAAQLDIQTGNPEWDLAFALGQKTALGLVHGPTGHLPAPSFVLTRQPDQGFSLRLDGTDYDHLWNGQTPLETLYLASLMGLAAPSLVEGFLHNFLATQKENGHVDWKPGLNGKRSGLLATPVLCTLAWDLYQVIQNQAFLEDVFPALLNFINNWFSGASDRDGDGIPEWDHPLQSGFEENPLFAHWQPWALASDITLFESPALCAMLHRECRTLLEMARALSRFETLSDLHTTLTHLEAALALTWDERQASYHYIDRDSHQAPPGKTLGRRKGPGSIRTGHIPLEGAARLVLRILPEGEHSRTARFRIQGTGPGNQPLEEEIPAPAIRWAFGHGTANSDRCYTAVEQVEVEYVKPADLVTVHTVDYQSQDHTLLTPLWAGIPTPEQASAMIKKNIVSPARYGKPYGLPACPAAPKPEAESVCESIWMPWNSLIGEGLVAYGHRALAAELVSRLMDAVTQTLRTAGVFRKHYNAKTGEGIGEHNNLGGLPPLGLFLATLGVKIYSPWRVRLEGHNPFPWPVTVRYRGLTVARGPEETRITFPDGQAAEVKSPAACLVVGRTPPALLVKGGEAQPPLRKGG